MRTLEQAEACRRENVRIILYPEDFRPEALESLITNMRPGDWLRLPEVCEEETLRGLLRFAERHADRLGGVVLGSIGQLGLRWPVPFAAGPGVPVMNREAAELLREEGCAFAWASPELSGEELRALLKASPLPLAAPVYGRTQLMLLHHCPARTALGLREGHRDCALCDRGDARALRGKALEDELGLTLLSLSRSVERHRFGGCNHLRWIGSCCQKQSIVLSSFHSLTEGSCTLELK